MGARFGWPALALIAATVSAASAGHAEGVPVSAATADQKAAAQALFVKATEKIQAGDHEGALAHLRGSFDVVASPNTRLLISRELVALGRHAEAYREAAATEALAQEAARSDPRYEETFRSVQAERAEIAKKVGFVKVDMAGQTGELVVGGRAVSAAERGGVIPVSPGAVEVVIRDARGVVDSRSVTVEAGAEASVSFAPVTTKPGATTTTTTATDTSTSHPFDGSSGQRITGIIVGGIGVVGFGLFAGFGAANQSIFSDLEDQCAGRQCPAALQDDADEGRTFQTAANISLVFGVVGLAGGAALLIPTFLSDEPESSASVRIQVGAGYLGLKGGF